MTATRDVGWIAFLALVAAMSSVTAQQGPDVVVVGAGPGGLATAFEAATGGARVTVVNVASVFGGHAVVSEGGLSFAGTPLQRSKGIVDAPDLMFDDIIRLGTDANPQWARLFADRGIPEIDDWLVSLGVTFTSLQRLDETPSRASTKIRSEGSASSSPCIAHAWRPVWWTSCGTSAPRA